VYVCCLDRGEKRDQNRMEQFNQTMSRAAAQEADRLAQKLVAAEAKIKELDEEADCLFDCEFLDSGEKKALDAARAVWLKRNGSQLPEIMTADQCSKAVKVGCDLLNM